MVRGVRIKDHWKEQRNFEQRALIGAGVIAFLILVLIARLFVLQVLRHDYYMELSQGNRVRVEPIPAARGLILDRNGEILASNQPAYQLELVREQVPDLEGTLRRLVEIGMIDPDDLDSIRKNIKSRRAFDSVPIRLRMSEEDVARFAVQRFEFPGVDIKTRQTRWYPHKEIAVHALGYVGAISERDLERIDRAAYAGTTLIGKIGIEAAFEDELHGTNGFREILVNAQGRTVEKQGTLEPDLRSQAPVSGNDLILSLDLNVQRVAEAALGDNRGAIVALDPNNGDVIALASRPGFDPNLFGRGLTRAEYDALQNNIDRPLLNRALRGTYPPGSTVKPAIALGALVHGIVTPNDTRLCRGFYMLPRSSHRYRDHKTHGTVAMIKAIAQSCDVYFYDVANELGVDRLAAWLARFGVGQPTGLDIGGEKTGILPSREWKRTAFKRPQDQVWFPGETVSYGIGQGYLLMTPMQLAQMTAIIAARGKSFKPRLVTAMRDSTTGEVRTIPPQPGREVGIGTPEQWQTIIDGMIAVTKGGTATRAAMGAPYTMAGKSGTAQVFTVAQNERYDESKISERLRDHALFIAFAPAEAPKIAVAVLVENGRSGSGTAAPMARQVIDAYLLGPSASARAPSPTS